MYGNILLPGAELPLVESFGLLNDLFPFPSILDAGYPVWIFSWQMSHLMLSSHLYLGLPCDLLVRGFQLNIFLTVLVCMVIYIFKMSNIFFLCEKTTWWSCENICVQWNLYSFFLYATFSCTYCLFNFVPKNFWYKRHMIISDVLFLKVSPIQNSWSRPTIFAELLFLRKNNESSVMFLECTVAVAYLYW
jgi:hypothetical protein